MIIRNAFFSAGACALSGLAMAVASGIAAVGGGVLVAHDDTAREILRSASPSFLEGSPGRDLPMDLSYSTFRFDVWPKVIEKCQAFETEHQGKLATPDLVAIAADTAEDPRAREMALWLLAARVTAKEDGGRSVAAQQLLPFGPEGVPRLSESLASSLVGGDRITRYSATVVLGAHGGRDSAEALVRAIKGPFFPERHAACRAIGRFGLEGLGVEGLGLLRTTLYAHHDVGTTLAATHALLLVGTLEFEQHGKTTAIDELVKALRYAPHAGEPRFRKDFGGWGTPGEVHVIGFTDEEIASGQRTDAFIRHCAAVALSRIDMHELQHHVFPAMLEALGDNEVGVVYHAFWFIDRVGVRTADWNAGPVLTTLVGAPDLMLSSRAVWAFSHWGERMSDHVPLLIDRVERAINEHGDLFSLIWTLGNSGDARAEAYLLRLRERIGPQTRPRDEEGNEVDTDKRWIKMIDEGVARIRQVQTIRNSDAGAQEKSLTEALAQPRRRYLAPTLLDLVKDPKRTEEMRVRCAAALRDIEPVAAPAWFSEVLGSQAEIPARLRGVLEQGRPARREDEE